MRTADGACREPAVVVWAGEWGTSFMTVWMISNAIERDGITVGGVNIEKGLSLV